LLKLGRWKSMRLMTRRARGNRESRLERLAARARAIILFERAWRMCCHRSRGRHFRLRFLDRLWIDAPHWARGLAFSPGTRLVIALLPLTHFVFPRARRRSRGSTAYPALHRIPRR